MRQQRARGIAVATQSQWCMHRQSQQHDGRSSHSEASKPIDGISCGRHTWQQQLVAVEITAAKWQWEKWSCGHSKCRQKRGAVSAVRCFKGTPSLLKAPQPMRHTAIHGRNTALLVWCVHQTNLVHLKLGQSFKVRRPNLFRGTSSISRIPKTVKVKMWSLGLSGLELVAWIFEPLGKRQHSLRIEESALVSISLNYNFSRTLQFIIELFLNAFSDTSYFVHFGKTKSSISLLQRIHLYTRWLGLVEIVQPINGKSSEIPSQEHILWPRSRTGMVLLNAFP